MFNNFKAKFNKYKSESNSKKVIIPEKEDNTDEHLEEKIVNSKPSTYFVPTSPVTIAIIGAGSRGGVYSGFAKYNPHILKIVAVVDIFDFRCKKLALEHSIPPENVFVGDWTMMSKVSKLADAVVICTPDRDHVGPAEAFSNLKYHILLEKPMSTSIQECIRIYEAIIRNEVLFTIGHPLPYTMYIRCIKKILDSGVLGDIINIQQIDMICYWHFAHSYVRGNWHLESSSSFSLLTKNCHDIDLLTYLMNQKCTKISSFGSLAYFKKEKKPKEAGDSTRCLECPIQDSCPYSAKKIYINKFENGWHGWPINVVQSKEPIDIENLTEELKTSVYGHCVYEMDNDVCDNQVVNMEFENGATASFTMMAFTDGMIRKTRIFGSMGELEGDGNSVIKVKNFSSGETTIHDPLFEMIEPGPIQWSGHGGGDFALIKKFVQACATGDPSHISTGPLETLESHMYVFAAEESRRTGKIINMENFMKTYLNSESTLLNK